MLSPTERGSFWSSPINTDITLLLLGETGVGKSTWINGFANFLQYDTLEKAEVSPTVFLVPASFTLSDENYEPKLVAVGADENEVTSVGQSATQQPQTYTFSKDGHTIRLIDTPGIGDVRGVEQDKKNFQRILSHIAHLEVINGICILLKPNNARLNVMFSFCIKELLANLHRDACRNIVFCFTNSRSTFYRPGDTLPALKKLISESKSVVMPLDHKTVYCMDNESIRFLYAIKNGIQFSQDERQNYANSWDKSVSEVSRLLCHVGVQTPHDVQNTLSLNNARQTVLALSKPLVNITDCIQKNLMLAEDKKRELSSSTKSKEELVESLFIPRMEVLKEELEDPRTVCTNIKCVKLVPVGEGNSALNNEIYTTEYTQNCHSGCSRGKKKHLEILEIVGHKSLKKCSAFNRKTGLCKTCGCGWEDHMKTMEVSRVEVIHVVDPELEEQLNEKNTAIEKMEVFLASIDKTLEELRDEQKQITNASAKFACFLKNNAIRPYNDSIIAYMIVCINHERNVQGEVKGQGEALRRLEKMKEVYEEEIRLLEKAVREGSNDPVTPEELAVSIEKLCSLKHNGEEFQRYISTSIAAESACYTEKMVEVYGKTNTVTNVKQKKKKGFVAGFVAALNKKKQVSLKGRRGGAANNMGKVSNQTTGAINPARGAINQTRGTINNSRGTVNNSGGAINNSRGAINNPVGAINNPGGAINNPVGTTNDEGRAPQQEQPLMHPSGEGKGRRTTPKRPAPLPPIKPADLSRSLRSTSGSTSSDPRSPSTPTVSPGQNETTEKGGPGPSPPPPPPPPPSVAPVQLPQGLEVGGWTDLMAQIRGKVELKKVEGEKVKGSGGKGGALSLADAMQVAMEQRRPAIAQESVDEDEDEIESVWL